MAAEQGDAKAQFGLAQLYEYGLGVERDEAAALEWYRKAAEQGEEDAIEKLKELKQKQPTELTPQELRKLQDAADQGDVEAMFELAVRHDFGDGVQQHNDTANYWYFLAAKAGHPEAQYRLGDKYLHGDGVAQNDAEALKWLRLSADQGHQAALECLGQ